MSREQEINEALAAAIDHCDDLQMQYEQAERDVESLEQELINLEDLLQ